MVTPVGMDDPSLVSSLVFTLFFATQVHAYASSLGGNLFIDAALAVGIFSSKSGDAVFSLTPWQPSGGLFFSIHSLDEAVLHCLRVAFS